MEKEISTEVLVSATPEKIWAILTDFESYPHWNPFVKSVKGLVAVGERITVRLEPPGASGMTFKPKVLAYETNKEFRWLGHLVFPGLFDGEHKFELIGHGNGTTTFRQSEKFKGILVGLFKKMLDHHTKEGFLQMNQKLKEMAEQQ